MKNCPSQFTWVLALNYSKFTITSIFIIIIKYGTYIIEKVKEKGKVEKREKGKKEVFYFEGEERIKNNCRVN